METSPPFDDPAVAAVFDAYPVDLRADLLFLRAQIFETAAGIDGACPLMESLKWGQPAYAPAKPRTGSTVRLDGLKNAPKQYGLFFHCQTTLVREFRELYPDQFDFEGNRALLFTHGKPVPLDALRHCIALSLTYHLRRRRAGVGRPGLQ